ATYRAVKGEVPDGDFTIPLGPAEVKREGTDITVFAYGLMLHHSLAAAETLAAEGVSVNVVDVRSLRPLDAATILREARKTGKCLIVYEDNRMFGAGAELAALIAEEARREGRQVRPPRRGADRQGEHGDPVTGRGHAQRGQGPRRGDRPDRDAPRHLRYRRRRGGGTTFGAAADGAAAGPANSRAGGAAA